MDSYYSKIWKVLSTFECWYLFIGCIALLPLFAYSNYHLEGTQLEKSLSNDNVRLVFAASASFAIPLLLDVIMDLSSPVASPSSFARLVLITSTCVPALIFISPSQQPQYGIANVYVIVAGAQRIIGRGATASVLRDFNPKMYNDRVLRAVTVLWYLAEILDLFGLAANNRPSRILSIVLKYFYLSITVISCSINIRNKCRKFRYFNCKRSFKDVLGDVGDDDYYSFVAMAITLASALGQALCPAVEPGGMFFVNTYTPTFLIVYTSIISVMALVTCIIPNRIVMNNSLKLQNELDHRRVFVRHISHEIRTPMNTAIVGLSLIESKLKEMTISPMSKYLLSLTNDVQESCEDAVKILSGILDYEKLGAGVMVLEQSWINPLPLFHDAVKPFIMLAQLKQITLRANSSDIPADKVENLAVYVDEAKIGQVVRNFVSNAIKFTPPGGSIDVVTSIVRHNLESFLRFEVIDSGPGIATADIGKVFNDVVQFNANTQQAGGGSGIGLWICKKIVDLHGGHVRVESVLGSGCKFILELYVKSDESGLSNLSSKAPSSKLAANILGSKKSARVVPSDSSSARSNPNRILKVLVVDDSKLNRKMMARLMESKGHNCLEACNGQEAVDICGAFVFDIILMDNCMPVLMGGEATRVLRSKGYKGVIIGVTGDALQRDVDDFLACGVNAVLSKPIDPFLFDEALQNIMRQHTADVS